MPQIGHLGIAEWVLAAALVAATGLVTARATRALIPILQRRNLLDHPNERSSHVTPTARGGGIAPVGVVLLAWTVLAFSGQVLPAVFAVVLATVFLAIVSWFDDVHDLSPATRLAAHAAAVAIGLAAVPYHPLPRALPPIAALVMLGLLWVWWVNLFNFMDGIDGLAGSESAVIGGGVLAVTGIGRGLDPALALLAGALLGAALGFLVWNWSPARVFLGDAGSIPLGYLSGFLLIAVAARGHWLAALILPLYFLADATITLVRRLLRGERVWQAHRQHYYQRAVRGGLSHAAVVRRVILANLVLIGCAWAAENGAARTALTLAVVTVASLIAILAAGRGRGRATGDRRGD